MSQDAAFQSVAVLIVAASIAAGLAYYMATRPKVAFAFVVAAICFVPFWIQSSLFPMPPATWAMLIALPAALKCRRDTFANPDQLFVVMVAIAAVAVGLRLSPSYALAAMLFQWATAYFIARTLGFHLGRGYVANVLAVAGTVLAAWAGFEYLVHWHVFENVRGLDSISFWAEIQARGGVDRSEGAFGHAIALGGFLAMTIPFVLTSSFRWKLPMAVVVAAGVLSTLSRGPILSGLLSILLVIVFVPRLSAGTKTWAIIGGSLAFALVAPPFLGRFSQLGEELDPSSQYRVDLWESVPGDLNIIGDAQGVGVDGAGRTLYRGYGSIDSTPLLVGIDFGWIVVLLLAGGMAAMCWRVVSLRSSAAEVALVAQIPTLATVALITQYQAAIWLVVGLAVAFRHQPGSASKRRKWKFIPRPTAASGETPSVWREPAPVDARTRP